MAANLERVTAPTLIMLGEDDCVHPAAMAHEFTRRIKGAQVEFLPASGHLPHEEHPDEFNRLVADFLAHQSYTTKGAAP